MENIHKESPTLAKMKHLPTLPSMKKNSIALTNSSRALPQHILQRVDKAIKLNQNSSKDKKTTSLRILDDEFGVAIKLGSGGNLQIERAMRLDSPKPATHGLKYVPSQ